MIISLHSGSLNCDNIPSVHVKHLVKKNVTTKYIACKYEHFNRETCTSVLLEVIYENQTHSHISTWQFQFIDMTNVSSDTHSE